MEQKIDIRDVTLRDGMHAIRHQYGLDDVRKIAIALDESGVDSIQITHGEGLCGTSLNYGVGAHSNWDWISTAAEVVKHATIATLLLPGIGTKASLKEAYEAGARCVYIATHCTEADISKQHIEYARSLDMEVLGFLMMSHMTDPLPLAAQAQLMAQYGAHCVFVADSAGAMYPETVSQRVDACRQALDPNTVVGIHCHNNLGFGIQNVLVAFEKGATCVDAALAGMGAGAGNTALEVLMTVMKKLGMPHTCDIFKMMDAADDLVIPLQQRPVRIDRETLSLGYAGVYSSFLRHAERASEQYGVDTREILIRLGELQMVGGQEDMIIDVALDLKKNNDNAV